MQKRPMMRPVLAVRAVTATAASVATLPPMTTATAVAAAAHDNEFPTHPAQASNMNGNNNAKRARLAAVVPTASHGGRAATPSMPNRTLARTVDGDLMVHPERTKTAAPLWAPAVPFSARNLESLPVAEADHHDHDVAPMASGNSSRRASGSAAQRDAGPSAMPAASSQPAAAVTATASGGNGRAANGIGGQRWFDASQHAAKFLQVADAESVRMSMLASKTAAFVEHLGFFEPTAGGPAVEPPHTRAFTLATVTGDPMMSCVYYEIDGAAPWTTDARAWTGRPCRVIGRWVPTTAAMDAIQHFQCYHVRAALPHELHALRMAQAVVV